MISPHGWSGANVSLNRMPGPPGGVEGRHRSLQPNARERHHAHDEQARVPDEGRASAAALALTQPPFQAHAQQTSGSGAVMDTLSAYRALSLSAVRHLAGQIGRPEASWRLASMCFVGWIVGRASTPSCGAYRSRALSWRVRRRASAIGRQARSSAAVKNRPRIMRHYRMVACCPVHRLPRTRN